VLIISEKVREVKEGRKSLRIFVNLFFSGAGWGDILQNTNHTGLSRLSENPPRQLSHPWSFFETAPPQPEEGILLEQLFSELFNVVAL